MTLKSRARLLWLHLRTYLHDIVEKVWLFTRFLAGLFPKDNGHQLHWSFRVSPGR